MLSTLAWQYPVEDQAVSRGRLSFPLSAHECAGDSLSGNRFSGVQRGGFKLKEAARSSRAHIGEKGKSLVSFMFVAV